MFKVEFLKNCKICNNPVPKGYRSYCSKKCRNRRNYRKFYKDNQRLQSEKRGKFEEGKRKNP